jgi:excinuclease ABC subunit A
VLLRVNIHIQGASEHNLRGIDIEFGDGLTVVTGVSGSGKTSLVFDTLYHEARRRYLEIFSLGSASLRLSPAKVEAITGLGPAIAVGQNVLNRNPNSTLATASGLHPFLRLLYARYGSRYCPRCGTGLSLLSEDEIVERVASVARQRPGSISVPLLQGVQGSHRTLLELLATEFGDGALSVDGRLYHRHRLDPALPHDIEIQIARITAAASAVYIREVVQRAAALGAHSLTVRSGDAELTLARAPTCVACGTWFGGAEPVHFHTPCPHCGGKGCERCASTGLHPEAAAVRWRDLRLPDLLARSVGEARDLFPDTELPSTGARLQAEIQRRLQALYKVGLGYISLDRPSPTLSRGEAQRVRLAVALTSRLEDMLHVLDEPTIGQHPADLARLLPAFRELAGPVVYVEHDRVAAAYADRAVDLGPGAGSEGGRLLFTGTPAELWSADTPTGRYFSLRDRVSAPALRPDSESCLTVRGAHLRNLQQIDVPFPLGRLTVVTGVSGSGKSTLVEDVLVASLAQGRHVGCEGIEGSPLKPVLVDQAPIGRNPRSNPATYTKLADIIRDCYAALTGLSASHFSFNRPEGACPACKGIGAVEVRMRYLPSTWIPCAACDGQRFSDEVLYRRAVFGDRSLSIADFLQLRVAQVIPLLTEDPRIPERRRQAGRRILEALRDVGLGYLPLGQPSPTLSGGEAQRVKLAKYLGRRSLASRLVVLDEPSTGLHPQDIAGLLTVLDRLVRAGATVVVVEHNTDIVRAADWIVDLGPGAGPAGGQLVYAGPPEGLAQVEGSITGQALREEAAIQPRSSDAATKSRPSTSISIRDARAHNLRGVDVDIPKSALTVVTGVSGSGKSSLVADVLETEARRRFLETLSLYERQSTREGTEAPVGSVTGLGVAITVGPERRRYNRRATVGTATEVSHHLAVLLSSIGERRCPKCGAAMRRVSATPNWRQWLCPACGTEARIGRARHFMSSNYASACETCHGVGSLQIPRMEKLIAHPDRPLCGGAMHSPGFFPKGYLCKPFNGGYDMVQALAHRHGFDPATTPWNEMAPQAQQAFLFGDPEPIQVTYLSRAGRTHTRTQIFPGFYGWIRDWDVGGTYTDTEPCPECRGARLRPEYLAVTLDEHNIRDLSDMPLSRLVHVLEGIPSSRMGVEFVQASLHTALRRLHFLLQVGLGYLHLNRVSSTLSAGEAQRAKLAGLLGSGLTSLTVLLDEPSRGLHPSEVQALLSALLQLRDEGNTVIVVEHDPVLIRAADHLIDLGPGAGVLGGKIVAQGTPEHVANTDTLTAAWLRGERRADLVRPRREPHGWLTIHGARANNLCGELVRLPLGTLTGVCGVSGSGKSSLLIDTLGRALAPKKQTTSVAREPISPGVHDSIEGAPPRTILVDQAKAGLRTPASVLGLVRPLHALFAAGEDAQALGLDAGELRRRCSVCRGSGSTKIDMGFLPDVYVSCETCEGTGYRPEAWDVRLNGVALPEVFGLTIDEVHQRFAEEGTLARSLAAARDVGLGYLVLRQPGHALSGGEAQRLKIARELCRRVSGGSLYILDEPTVGQHMEDVARLLGVLHGLVDHGHTVVVIEHHPHVLAACDWLLELGPGGGPDGGRVIATGRPEHLAGGDTPTAPYLRAVLEAQ